MNKTIGFVAALTLLLAMSSCGKKLGQFSSDYFTTNPNPLEAVGHKVPATVTGNIPPKFFQKNAEVTVTPYLVYDGNDTPSQSYSFQGESVRGNSPVVNYEHGGSVTIPVQFNYSPAMAKSKLELAFTVKQGTKQYVLPRVQVATGVIGTAALSNVGTVKPALAADKYQRIVNEKYSADIMFLINVANIRADQLKTNAMEELWAEIRNSKNSDNRVLREVNIESYASPEGKYDFNYKLAGEREKNTDEYVRHQLQQQKITEFGELTSQFTAEDWEGFKKLVQQSNIQDKDLILNVLTMYKDPEERERQLRYLSSIFEQLADQILPQLRYSRITASIDVLGKTDEELIDLARNNPIALNVDEILYAATLTDNPAIKQQIYQSASALHPKDYRVWNNLGMVQYQRGNYNGAKASFAKSNSLQNNPEANMNLALISMLEGNYAQANQLLGSAAGVNGLDEALGTYYLEMGDNAAAAHAFGDVKSNNAALAQILTKNYAKAKTTLESVNSPDATTFYLAAILGARTNNEGEVLSNLRKAIQLDQAMANRAANDMEFAGYSISNLLR